VLALALLGACERPAVYRIGVVVGYEAGLVARMVGEEVAREGGIDGVPLEIVVAPHASPSSAAPAISRAEEFARDPSILAVVGHSNSGASLAASPIYNSAGLVQIAPTSTAPGFRNAGPYTFTMVPDDSRQAAFLADMIETLYTPSRVVIIYVNDDYGRGLVTELREQLDRTRGLQIDEYTYLEVPDTILPTGRIARSIELSGKQFELAIDRMRDAPPDLLVWLGRPAALGDFRRLLPESLRGLPILGSDALDTPMLYDNEDHLFGGIRFVRMADPDVDTPEGSRLRQRFSAETNLRLSTEALLTYDAVQMVVAALRSGARTREQVREKLAAVGLQDAPFQGVAGVVRFDSNGQADRAYQLMQAGDSGLVRVGRR